MQQTGIRFPYTPWAFSSVGRAVAESLALRRVVHPVASLSKYVAIRSARNGKTTQYVGGSSPPRSTCCLSVTSRGGNQSVEEGRDTLAGANPVVDTEPVGVAHRQEEGVSRLNLYGEAGCNLKTLACGHHPEVTW